MLAVFVCFSSSLSVDSVGGGSSSLLLAVRGADSVTLMVCESGTSSLSLFRLSATHASASGDRESSTLSTSYNYNNRLFLSPSTSSFLGCWGVFDLVCPHPCHAFLHFH
ncbi:hypothetical protein P8452_63048 [Trifolium repens]|jgi:hypothetical protein|nr:hypothetical protein QL285_041118 [Trifolium repens]WJX79993.1 hypothetical protein P8452_63048 [Trifolium repens]